METCRNNELKGDESRDYNRETASHSTRNTKFYINKCPFDRNINKEIGIWTSGAVKINIPKKTRNVRSIESGATAETQASVTALTKYEPLQEISQRSRKTRATTPPATPKYFSSQKKIACLHNTQKFLNKLSKGIEHTPTKISWVPVVCVRHTQTRRKNGQSVRRTTTMKGQRKSHTSA